MSSRLPEFVDPFHLAEKGREFKGNLALLKMKRIASLVIAGSSDGVQVEIRFDKDPSGQSVIYGRVKTVLQLQCQRCLEAMDFSVDAEFRLGVVSTLVESAKLPESYEPLVVEEIPLSLAEIIEDEILLALPAVAMHDIAICPTKESNVGGDKPDANEIVGAEQNANKANMLDRGKDSADTMDMTEKPNPFAVLADLKSKLGKQ